MESSPEMAEAELIRLLGAAIQLAPVPLLVADGRGRLVTANRQWRLLTGPDPAEGRSDGWTWSLQPGGRRRLTEELCRVASSGASSTIDLEMSLPGGPRWTRWWLQRREIDGIALAVVAVIDVHEDVAQRDDLRQLATHDDLTGLVNRRFFLETVDQALRRAERFPEPACLLYVDLDGFKTVNDRAGHNIGDRVLSAVAARLGLAVRAADVVGRIGGDEFAVLIERLTSPGEAAIVGRRIQEALNGRIDVAGERWSISASVGMAMSRPGDDAASLLGRADEAMYGAKRSRVAATGPPEPEEQPAVDVRSLKEGVDTIKRSLESLLRGIDSGSD